MATTFSVITCTWNSAQYLRESIASVLSQTHQDIEYIFVDGGSTDGTLDIIRSVPRPYKLIENIRGGISNAMNEGIKAATGDVIAHLHSDDYYLNANVLADVANHFETSRCKWLFGRTMSVIDGKLVAEGYRAPRYNYPQLLKGNFIPHPSTFVQRELMVRTGGFDTKLKYAMDYDLWLKLARISAPLQIDDAYTAFREHEGSLSTRNRVAAMEEDFRVRLSHAGIDPLGKIMHYARYFVRRQRAIQAGTGK